MTKHITKIRPQAQLKLNDISSAFIKDGALIQSDMALGTFTGEVFLDGSIATAKLTDGSKFMMSDGTTPRTANVNMGGFRVTNLGAGLSAGDAVTRAQLDSVISEFSAFEWQPSANAIATDPSVLAPAVGDRFLISGPGVDLWAAHGNQIAEYTGVMEVAGGWEYTTPKIGMVINVDDVGDRFYLWGGIAWEEKWLEVTTASTGLVKVGFDIQIDPLAAGSGIRFTGGTLSIDQGNGILVSDDGVAVDVGATAGKIPQYDPAGNLGVGVDPALARLHVAGTARIDDVLEVHNAVDVVIGAIGLVSTSSAGSALKVANLDESTAAGVDCGIAQETAAVWGRYQTNNAFALEANPLKPSFILAGDFGIGTSAPEAKLHVVGNAKVNNNLDVMEALKVWGNADFDSAVSVVGDLNLESPVVMTGLSLAAAPDADHGVLYFSNVDKRLHLKTDLNEQIVGGEEVAIVGEQPVGQLDGVNTVFTMLHTPIGNSEAVYLNGMRATRGIDYTVAGNQLLFSDAPYANHVLRVDYRRVILI